MTSTLTFSHFIVEGVFDDVSATTSAEKIKNVYSDIKC